MEGIIAEASFQPQEPFLLVILLYFTIPETILKNLHNFSKCKST